jgi:hypothetical protein
MNQELTRIGDNAPCNPSDTQPLENDEPVGSFETENEILTRHRYPQRRNVQRPFRFR